MRMSCKLFLQFALLFLCQYHYSQGGIDPVRLMNYNLLNYPATNITQDTTARHPEFRIIMADVSPDILVAQEVTSQNGVNMFLNKVLNIAGSGYAAADFVDGPDTDNALFYRTSKFEFISNTVIKTELRNINEFKLRHLLSGDTLRIYAVHLKASNMSSDEAQRGREVDSLRKVTNQLPSGSNFIVCGDFNVYSSTEICYSKLKQILPGNEGHVIDPVTITGSWNSASYAQFHTQSPRIRSFGGGVTGGMDDRFDMILYSSALSNPGNVDYVSGSLVTYGNDGLHYNDSINDATNFAVGPVIANALHNASDHIPIHVTLNFNYFSPIAEDIGVQTVISPIPVLCPASGNQLVVAVKNYSVNDIDFGVNNVPVTVQVTKPDLTTQTFSAVLNSGLVSGGGTINLIITSSLNLTAGGNYSLLSYTQSLSDVNHLNDTNHFTIYVNQINQAVTFPSGNITVCNGSSQTITASAGVSFLWSDNSTSSSITISNAGQYLVTITDTSGCTSASAPVTVTLSNGAGLTGVAFVETMGVPSATTALSLYETNNGFDNDNLTMSGSGDVRTTSASSVSNYATASGGGNVFLSSGASRSFSISGINTLQMQNPQLSFGVLKSTTTSTGSDLEVKVSADGINFTSLSFSPLPTGSGTATWHYRTATGTIPATASLIIQFTNTNTGTNAYRLDDIRITYIAPAIEVLSFSPQSGSEGDTVLVTGSGFSQLNGVSINGVPAIYIPLNDTSASVVVPGGASSGLVTIVSSTCNRDTSLLPFIVLPSAGITINLSVFIEGFYAGNEMLSVSDTILVELYEAIAPNALVSSRNSLIDLNGYGTFFFPEAILGESYFIAIHHRNSLTTWSKLPVLMNATTVSFSLINQ